MSERITGELRDAMNVDREYTMGGDVVARTYCMGRDEFTNLCDAIDSIHANLERENDRLKCELDRVLGELDEMHKTDGISDNSSGFMHEASITDELREWWVRKFPVMDKELHEDFSAIADRIDAEHQRQLEVLYRDMSDAEYVKLPKDADGEYIRIGDVLDGYGKTIEVVSGAESIPVLERAIAALGDETSDNYWKGTEGNAKRPLMQLLAFARMRPDGVWDGD